MQRQLFNVVVPNGAQTVSRSELRQRLSTQGLLQGDQAAVEHISLEAGEQILHGNYRGKYARKLAAEIEELFNASGYDAIPFFAIDGTSKEDGYYSVRDIEASPADPRVDDVHTFEGTITRKGTRRTHYRSVATKTTQLDHPWGNDTTAYLGIPASAEKVRWFDSSSKSVAEVDVVETRAGEFGDVDIVDADAAPADHTELLMHLPYDQEWQTAARVWDTRDLDSKLDADDIPQWQRAYRTSHEWIGTPVLENGLIRLEADEDANTLTASEWDEDADDWSDVSLGDSDWELYEWDLRSLSPARIVSIVEFRDPTTSSYYTLRAIVHRGSQTIQFDRSGLEDSAVPDGLVDLLDPIASTSIKDPGESQGLRKRSEVKG